MDSQLVSSRPRAETRVRRTPASEEISAVLVSAVARSFRVRTSALTAPGRTAAREALARHVAMYLAHVLFGWTYSQVAPAFGRHRTSVLYACARVEDRRDDLCFDARLVRLERNILSALDAIR
jgi:chromosomal replication initiation ATPase DnaA